MVHSCNKTVLVVPLKSKQHKHSSKNYTQNKTKGFAAFIIRHYGNLT